MIKSISFVLIFACVASALPRVTKNEENNNVPRNEMSELFDAEGNSVGLISNRKVMSEDDSELDNKLISYEPKMNKVKYPELDAFFSDLEKGKFESASKPVIVDQKVATKPRVMDQVKQAPETIQAVMQQKEPVDPEREERIKLIAHNSREVRLVGPEEREIEMKDDAATKMAVAMENLRKEATEVWGQVNTKLDKGWTEFKTMVEDAVESAKKKSAAANSSSTMDDIATAADTTVKTIKEQAEVAGTKIKGFFNNLGVKV